MTLAAVIVGGIAATSAARAYALEAEPVIVVRQRTFAEAFSATDEQKRLIELAPLYVVVPNPTLREVITLRPYEASTDDPNFGRSGRVALPQAKPSLVFIMQNVGRSPAVDVTIGWNVQTTIFLEKPDLNDLKVGEQVGSGDTRVAALAPRDSTYLRIENSLGSAVRLSVQPVGTQTDWRTTRRPKKKIAIVADAPTFELKTP